MHDKKSNETILSSYKYHQTLLKLVDVFRRFLLQVSAWNPDTTQMKDAPENG